MDNTKKRYELVKKTTEIKLDSRAYQGITYHEDMSNVEPINIFDCLEDAKKSLQNYSTNYDLQGLHNSVPFYILEEYHIVEILSSYEEIEDGNFDWEEYSFELIQTTELNLPSPEELAV